MGSSEKPLHLQVPPRTTAAAAGTTPAEEEEAQATSRNPQSPQMQEEIRHQTTINLGRNEQEMQENEVLWLSLQQHQSHAEARINLPISKQESFFLSSSPIHFHGGVVVQLRERRFEQVDEDSANSERPQQQLVFVFVVIVLHCSA